MHEFILLLNRMSPYLLLGFLLAGVLHAFIPARTFTVVLSKNNFRSVLYAALIGIPLPLCSCGVIPTAMSLKREGASRGAVTAFLIATPQTGLDSIMATFSLMGLPFAIARPVCALLTSLCGGAIANALESREQDFKNSCPEPQEMRTKLHSGFLARVVEALRYAFVDMMVDIGKWLFLGLLIAGLITTLVPEEAFTVFQGNTGLSMILVLLIAVPMYICATGSIPVAVALVLKGLTPGAALVLLMAGPACNLASILVVRKAMGNGALVCYLLSIIAGAVLFGCGIDMLQSHNIVDFTAGLSHALVHAHSHTGLLFNCSCTALLLILLCNALRLGLLPPSKSPKKIDMQARIFRIKGMSCNHCRMSAEKALQAVQGVESVHVDLASGTAQITGQASFEALADALNAIGFTLLEP